MSPDRPNLWRILSDASGVISAHSGHFLALSILFIFPSNLAAAIYTLLSNPLETLYLRILALFSAAAAASESLATGESQLIPQLLISLVSLLFSTCAVASIAASTFNGFYGKPVEFIPTLRSVLRSFLPLLATTLLVEIVIGAFVFAVVTLLFLANNALASIGFDIAHIHSEYFLILYIAIGVSMAALLFYVQIEWGLSSAVVVVESDWGFAALKRSSYLVKGARGVMFVFYLFFGISAGVLAICYLKFVVIGGEDGWSGWLMAKIVVFSCFSTLLSLYSVAALTVFFIYCKASRHELEFEIDGKFAADYFRLPSNVHAV